MKPVEFYEGQKSMLLKWIDDITIFQQHATNTLAALEKREKEVSIREACNVEYEAVTDVSRAVLVARRTRLAKAEEEVKHLREILLARFRTSQSHGFGFVSELDASPGGFGQVSSPGFGGGFGQVSSPGFGGGFGQVSGFGGSFATIATTDPDPK